MHRFAAIAAVLASGCSASERAANDEAGTTERPQCAFSCLDASLSERPLAEQVRSTLDSCSGADCHNIGAGNMSILPGSEFAALIGVRASERPDLFRVQPGDPLQSYVYIKLLCEGGVVSSCMPPGGAAPGLAHTFYDWIEAGAPTM